MSECLSDSGEQCEQHLWGITAIDWGPMDELDYSHCDLTTVPLLTTQYKEHVTSTLHCFSIPHTDGRAVLQQSALIHLRQLAQGHVYDRRSCFMFGADKCKTSSPSLVLLWFAVHQLWHLYPAV